MSQGDKLKYLKILGNSTQGYNGAVIDACKNVTGRSLGYNGAMISLLRALTGSSNTSLPGIQAQYAGKYGASWGGASKFPVFAQGYNLMSSLPQGTFTRASDATYVDDNGVVQTVTTNEPRFTSNGILIEGASTNLLTYSEEFDNAAWTKTNSTISADATTAPDGSSTADKFIPDDTIASGDAPVSAIVPGNQTNPVTFSFYAKAAEFSGIRIRINPTGDANRNASFDVDLTDGTISNTTSGSGTTIISTSVDSLVNGWYRLSLSIEGHASDLGDNQVQIVNTDTGDGSSGVYIWGAQLEESSIPTSYIPTAGSTVTRAADSLSYDLSGASWFNDGGAGTMVVEAMMPNIQDVSEFPRIVALSDGSTTNRIVAHTSTTTSRMLVTDASVSQVNMGGATLVGGTPFKIAMTWDANDFALYIDGTQTATDLSGSVPSGLTELHVGHREDGAAVYETFGYIKSIKYYDYRVPNADLARLTA